MVRCQHCCCVCPQKRSRLVKHLNDSDPSTTSPLMEGTPTIKSHRKLLQIIDTTLLQCYLHVRTLPSSAEAARRVVLSLFSERLRTRIQMILIMSSK